MTEILTISEPQFNISITENSENITIQETVNVIEITNATSIAGPQGQAGPQNLFIQDSQPVYSGAYVWFKTNMPGGGIDILVEDGL